MVSVNKVKERAIQRYLALLAGVLIVSTVTLLFVSIVQPELPNLSPEQRWYANVSGAALGFLWFTVGVALAALADSEFRPSIPGIFVTAGIGLIFVFNGAFVSDPLVSLVLRYTGIGILATLASWGGYSIYHSPWAGFEAIEK